MKSKVCSKKECEFARLIQPLENFSKDEKRKNKLNPQCKACIKEYQEIHKKDIKHYKKQWYQENRKKIIKKRYLYKKKKLEEDIEFKIAERLRTRLYCALKGNFKSGSAIADLMMSIADFKLYLEKRWYPNPDTGEMMSWENYGQGWHIDHIIPLSAFDLTNREELLKAVHFSNLRPMWAEQNISEGARGMARKK